MTDPVCHIPPVTETNQPGPLALPSIPPAQPTLQSLAHTVNQMRQVVLILAGQQGTQGRPGAPNRAGDNNKTKGTWVENARVSEKVKIYQNNDKTSDNWIEVERINGLTMGNKDTGQTWKWSR